MLRRSSRPRRSNVSLALELRGQREAASNDPSPPGTTAPLVCGSQPNYHQSGYLLHFMLRVGVCDRCIVSQHTGQGEQLVTWQRQLPEPPHAPTVTPHSSHLNTLTVTIGNSSSKDQKRFPFAFMSRADTDVFVSVISPNLPQKGYRGACSGADPHSNKTPPLALHPNRPPRNTHTTKRVKVKLGESVAKMQRVTTCRVDK
ncbi:hypothetical protein E2C01_055768 [Portunus trituberculatus]|uniref:Uncharacterized protein n=1 Tax=Portunus trituberculatus TaxID=210409 RepID=A0A5B7GVM5_PORTR|nr:hypothetical protein [Portunus trituberculatus]